MPPPVVPRCDWEYWEKAGVLESWLRWGFYLEDTKEEGAPVFSLEERKLGMFRSKLMNMPKPRFGSSSSLVPVPWLSWELSKESGSRWVIKSLLSVI